MAEDSGTYADVEVIERRRIRVAFNDTTITAEVMRKLTEGDFYDITDEEHGEYLSVQKVEWLGSEGPGDD